MISTPPRILVARDPVDFRKGIAGLAAVCEVHLGEEPLDGTLFVSIIGSCMLQGIDPFDYLVDVLGRIQDHPTNRLGELTPRAWRRAREDHPAG